MVAGFEDRGVGDHALLTDGAIALISSAQRRMISQMQRASLSTGHKA